MKKVFISILSFYLVFHFIIPGLFFLYDNNNFNTYTNVADNQAILKGFILNAITIIGAIIIIILLPQRSGAEKIQSKFYKLTPLFYISILFSIVYFFMSGGFEGKITGGTLGSVFNYIQLFLNPYMILLCVLFFQKKRFNAVLMFLIYLVFTTLLGSRSGFISLFIVFLMYPIFSNYQLYKKNIKRLLLSLAIISPILFLLATILIRKADIPLTPDIIARMIMGRLSFLETSMLPIHYKDANDSLGIFYEKYSVINQLKLIVDALFPGNLFGGDVMPNQYYRAAFMGYPISFVVSVYTSINITLPIYLYMYLGSFFACVFGIGILVLYYKLWVMSAKYMFIFIPLLASLYHLLYFFDWVMWFMQFFTFFLTSLTIYGFSLFRVSVVNIIKNEVAYLKPKEGNNN